MKFESSLRCTVTEQYDCLLLTPNLKRVRCAFKSFRGKSAANSLAVSSPKMIYKQLKKAQREPNTLPGPCLDPSISQSHPPAQKRNKGRLKSIPKTGQDTTAFFVSPARQ